MYRYQVPLITTKYIEVYKRIDVLSYIMIIHKCSKLQYNIKYVLRYNTNINYELLFYLVKTKVMPYC